MVGPEEAQDVGGRVVGHGADERARLVDATVTKVDDVG